MCLARNLFASWIFGTPREAGLVVLLGVSLLIVIGFNYLICLFTALRNMRLVAAMEFTSSLLFALLGLALMAFWQPTAWAMVVAYTAACLVSALGGATWLAHVWHTLPQIPHRMPQRELWSRLLPFAAWMMLINLMWNLFDVVDRYMIIHYSTGTSAEALIEVGNYRSSRVLPLLLASLTAMIAGVVLPHFSHDWEAGRRNRVSERLNLLLKVWAWVLTAAAASALLIAPLLFQIAFEGKFAAGFGVLRWTLVYCAWFGLTMLVQTYLWCAEKANLASLVALIGVVINVVLNCLLLPRLGLLGAVLATTAANFAALILMVALSCRLGFRVHRGTLVMLVLPLVVCLGPWVALIGLMLMTIEILLSNRLFSVEEKQELLAGVSQYTDRLPWLRRRTAT